MSWTKVERCKDCGRHPLIIPLGRKREFLCEHGGEMPVSEKFSTPEEWNKAQGKGSQMSKSKLDNLAFVRLATERVNRTIGSIRRVKSLANSCDHKPKQVERIIQTLRRELDDLEMEYAASGLTKKTTFTLE